MIAVRLLSRDYIVQQLWLRKCRFVKDYGYNELWATTKIKHHFTVPAEGPDKQCADYIFSEILGEIDQLQGHPSSW